MFKGTLNPTHSFAPMRCMITIPCVTDFCTEEMQIGSAPSEVVLPSSVRLLKAPAL